MDQNIEENIAREIAEQQDEIEHSHAAVYMLRTVQQHHVQLSLMADQKANILVGACLVIVTICFTQIGVGNIVPALVVWGVFSIGAAATGALAVLPRFSSKSRIIRHRNPLFFGGFATLSDEEYADEMMGILEDDTRIMKAMIRDIHQLGCVLHFRKYRYLNLGYKVFLIGLLLTLVTAVLDFAGVF